MNPSIARIIFGSMDAIKNGRFIIRPPEVFLGKVVWKCVANLQDFVEMALRYGCSPVNLLHISRKPIYKNHCVKSFRILRISPYSVQMRENAGQNNFEYEHFLRSEVLWRAASFHDKIYKKSLWFTVILKSALFKNTGVYSDPCQTSAYIVLDMLLESTIVYKKTKIVLKEFTGVLTHFH